MRTFRHKASAQGRSVSKYQASIGLFLAGIVLSVGATNCLSSDACLRFSDCAEGLTCAMGKCVVPPAQVGDEGGVDEAGTEDDSSTPVSDSSTPVGDSSVSDSGADDSGDASDDAAEASDD
jgi:hypothetical protein